MRGWLARGELAAAAAEASSAQTAISESDYATLRERADRLAAHARAAAGLTGDPVWRGLEWTPWLGANLKAVRELSAALDESATDAIVPLAQLTNTIDPSSLRASGSVIDPEPIVAAQPTVHAAAAALHHAAASVGGIPSAGLAGPVAGARKQLAAALGKAARMTAELDKAAQLLPALLGADGPRNYLVLFLNNAELRAGGGIPGELALLHTDHGNITLGRQASTADFPNRLQPGIPVSADTAGLYGQQPGEFIQDVTLTPDFAQTGALAAAMWQRQFGDQIDGVIAVDPVGLSYLLDVTGPVEVPGGPALTAANAVQALLVDVYARVPDAGAQDAYFNTAASAAFHRLLTTKASPRALLAAVAKAADENRISLWSARPSEQRLLAGTPFGGMVAAQVAAGEQAYGVYFNDAGAAKLGPYLRSAIDVTTTPGDDGRRIVSVHVTMTNTAPADAAANLPSRVTGDGFGGLPPGRAATNVAVYAPIGAFEYGVERDGQAIGYFARRDAGRQVQSVQLVADPGQSVSYTFRFLSAKPGQDAPRIVHTPAVGPVTVTGAVR